MPVYEEKLISPFAIRFSQEHIRTTFKDGRLLEETIAEIDSKEGAEEYDLILNAPFPHIEIARWRPKGKERNSVHWFTLDNRRLYCLQRVAASLWPKTVAVVVQILYDDGGSMWKKYDSSSCGRSVSIAHRLKSSELSRWDWYQECVVKGSSTNMAQAARVVLLDDDKEVVDDLLNTTDETGYRLAVTVDEVQDEVQGSNTVSVEEESEVMLELARRCENTKRKEVADASRCRSEGSDSPTLCPTPSTSIEDTDGDSEEAEDDGVSTNMNAGAFGNGFQNNVGYGGYCGYGGYNGHGGYGGYSGFGSYGCGVYPNCFNPSVAMLHAQQAAFHAQLAAAQHLRFQAAMAQQVSLHMQPSPARPARGRAARSKTSSQ